MNQNQKTLIVIPCFNEAGAIESLLKELDSTIKALDLKGVSVLVVDDGSIDDTSSIAKKHVQVLKLPVNLGIGGAVQAGIKYAQYNGFDFCIQMDGDAQHPPAEIPKLFKAFAETGANLLIGSRFIENDSFRSTTLRRLGISVLRMVILLLGGQRMTDPTSGFRLLDRKCITLFAHEYPYDYPEPVSIGMALESHLKVVEVPVVMRERVHGTSSITGMKTALYMFRVVLRLTVIRLRRLVT